MKPGERNRYKQMKSNGRVENPDNAEEAEDYTRAREMQIIVVYFSISYARFT